MVWPHLAQYGPSGAIFWILGISYLLITALPWFLAAMIAIFTKDEKRSKRCLEVLRLLGGRAPWWWPRGPKVPP